MSELIERPAHINTLTEVNKGMPKGLDLASPYEEPSYGKIVQGSSKEPFKPKYEDGVYLSTPDMNVIAMPGEVFHFTPIFYYPEFVLHNPYGSGLDWVREKTLDPNSVTARRCVSRDPEVNSFVCPEDKKERKCYYSTHQCYVYILLDHNEDIGELPIVHSFHGGEAKRGNSFRKLIKARKCAEMYACRFQASTSIHQKDENMWHGLDICNPEDGDSWVTEEQLNTFRMMYEEAAETFKYRGINVDYEFGADGNTLDADSVVASNDEKY